ncbi:paraquat-inducible protein A [Muricoccus aerilatus]|uniref:paraquat-inducible protein A n=1 Tax=Muricoccus aerilatus TaxID=452982 RepID=UPI0006948C3E|nr:PqiA/YebS family transporter subunit [Roseomonas aerilata]
MTGAVPFAGAPSVRPVLECDGCGERVRLPAVGPRVEACCPRCDTLLHRGTSGSADAPLALALGGLALYAVTMAAPFLSLNLLGRVRVSGVESGAGAFVQQGYPLLSVLVVFTLVFVPLARLLLLLLVLLGLRMREAPRWLFRPFGWHEWLGGWAMVEVFLFGALVSYTRLRDLAQVELGPAAYGLAALAFTLVAVNAVLRPSVIWEALERRGATAAALSGASEPAEGPLLSCERCRRLSVAAPGSACPRCATRLHPRKPNSLARTWALVVAALILYVPANAYPVMEIVSFGRGGPHTILGGVKEFVQTGFWPLALIVFLASVAVPMLKLLGLVVMLLGVHRRSATGLRARTRLYHLVEAIGRWSMIDVFVVSVLIAVVRFGNLASINAQIGATCFAAVVVLTILAAQSFDPRLMWDAAGRPGGERA